ncbi:heterogeneous nuclear ribonucleoprotein L-like isoform X3 [Amphibalanus amphitrite]|uniref:heterogeneous nuclear ribonucleoprotein L-like isoform X1 n=1 Tax=Amphibalanus amphitrite TaxID=1232801 RepID=UPI001C8FAB7C|nr:heterogeneous nuclear ribonucleoprotein L-like isoform X1 [Amphibalanus amphitrite]XP_043218040.1 heterogeneous nuclear ribonucleoprotein L-like isoform X3 [Amphibalanus amphitrite]
MAMLVEGYTGKRLRPDDALGHPDDTIRDAGPPRKRRDFEPEKPNHILLMTVVNPVYPITVDVIKTISSSHGQVLRIVIFKKNGVQAMVEFDSVEAAARAKEALTGADIYSGCCTLRIEFAKPARLNVYKNDAESWDYTNPALGVTAKPELLAAKTPLLQEPHFPGFALPYGLEAVRGSPLYGATPVAESLSLGRFAAALAAPAVGATTFNPAELALQASPPAARAALSAASFAAQPAVAPASPRLAQQGAVLMVYGLNKDMMNAERLFNLFCLYGNVIRIKFLKTKEGCAMVQLGDALAVERAIGNLNNINIFGSKLQLGYSKQAFLNNVQQPYSLPDGTPSFKDFTGCKNNRFLNPGMASKNRIQAPSKVLHFFNMPPQLAPSELTEIFQSAGAATPLSANIFPSKTERSSSGLVEFRSTEEAVEALVVSNHKSIPRSSSKFPFTMKLCFSSSRAGNGGGSDRAHSSPEQVC